MPAKSKTSKKPKPTRSETLGLRLDPRLKYALELLARAHRRSISGAVEWCVDKALKEEVVEDYHGRSSNLYDAAFELWDVDPLQRLVAINLLAPRLATFEEAQAFRILQDTTALWSSSVRSVNTFTGFMFADPDEVLKKLSEMVNNGQIRRLTKDEIEKIEGTPF